MTRNAAAAGLKTCKVTITDEQKRTLSLLSPIATTSPELIVPRTNLPEQLRAEVLSSEPVKLFVAGQRGMGKSTELRRFVDLLAETDFNPIFLQFGSQERIDQPGLLRLMVAALQADMASDIDDKSVRKFEEWFNREEISELVEEGIEGTAKVGGSLVLASATGGLKHNRVRASKKSKVVERSILDLVARFNAVIEKTRKKSGRMVMFVVDDIDKVQDANSINATFIHASHIIGSIACPCIFTVPITYATSNFVRIAGLPYNGIYRVPAVDLFDQHGTRNASSQAFMRRVFELRMPYNPLSDELLDRVLDLSGGVIIDAMRMLRGICKKTMMDSSAPVVEATVEAEFQHLVDDYQFVVDSRPLWHAVAAIASSRDHKSVITDGLLPELLYKMIVIEYRNQKVWFDLHPAARRLFDQNPEILNTGNK